MKKLIGIAGYARSGKDTFFARSAKYLNDNGLEAKRYAFADALKSEVDSLLTEYTGISAFTEKDSEKEIVRPLLVTYGTEIRRKLNPNCWIEKITPSVGEDLDKGKYVFITDVRFENEAQWIKSQGGLMVYIEREGIKPANHEEHTQNIRMKKYLNYKIFWPTFGFDDLDKCDEHIEPTIAHILQSEPNFSQVM
jgi:hypothetical protein